MSPRRTAAPNIESRINVEIIGIMTKKYHHTEEITPKVCEPVVAYKARIPQCSTEKFPPNALVTEEMHAILSERICRAEAGLEEIIPNQVVFDTIRTKYGF